MTESIVSDVDKQGNCSVCGGIHYGTGSVCVYKQKFPDPPTQVKDERVSDKSLKWWADNSRDLETRWMARELQQLRASQKALVEALQNVVDGNDIAFERGLNMETWPESKFAQQARAALEAARKAEA